MNKRIKSDLLLFITAIIWGSAFVAQKSGGEIGAFTFNGIRTFIGGLSLIPVIILMDGFKKNKTEHEEETKEQRKAMFIGGISCGILLFAASTLQQYGISYTTVGKAGFITSLYTILVSIISIIIGKKVRPIIWICVVTGAIGLYLLCVPSGEEFSFQIGDVLVFLCAIIFAIHILVVDHFSPKTNGVKMSCIQFLVAGGIGIVMMFIFENPNLKVITDNWFTIIYAGIFSCGIAYTLQILGQKDADPTDASLILSLESVFSVITGAIVLHEYMKNKEIIGCMMILGAVLLSQLSANITLLKRKKQDNNEI